MANFPNNAALPRGGIDSRSVFITRTYTHLVAGILGFILVELGLFESGMAEQVARFMFGFNWMLILAAFMLTGWLALSSWCSTWPRTWPIPRSAFGGRGRGEIGRASCRERVTCCV